MPLPHEQGRSLAAVSGVTHGFFGRRGGCSVGDFASANMSVSVGDDPRRVAANREAACASLGRAVTDLALVKQTHSTAVRVVTEAENAAVEADALVTSARGILLGILTADCTPVLLADREARVIGAFHAGWKGAIGGIAQATVVAMASLGADPARMVAAIGPTISQRNYEVGPEFAASLLARHRDAANRLNRPNGGREHFDLPGFVFDQLHEAGVGLVEDLALCTYAEPKRYFSHRYATHHGTTTGRQIALIGLS